MFVNHSIVPMFATAGSSQQPFFANDNAVKRMQKINMTVPMPRSIKGNQRKKFCRAVGGGFFGAAIISTRGGGSSGDAFVCLSA